MEHFQDGFVLGVVHKPTIQLERKRPEVKILRGNSKFNIPHSTPLLYYFVSREVIKSVKASIKTFILRSAHTEEYLLKVARVGQIWMEYFCAMPLGIIAYCSPHDLNFKWLLFNFDFIPHCSGPATDTAARPSLDALPSHFHTMNT